MTTEMAIAKLVELLGGLVLIGGAVLIVYFIARYSFLTKKMLAEKGLLDQRSPTRFTKQDMAYITVGLGIGLFISAGLSQMDIRQDTFDLLSWGIILLFGALGQIIAAQKKQ